MDNHTKTYRRKFVLTYFILVCLLIYLIFFYNHNVVTTIVVSLYFLFIFLSLINFNFEKNIYKFQIDRLNKIFVIYYSSNFGKKIEKSTFDVEFIEFEIIKKHSARTATKYLKILRDGSLIEEFDISESGFNIDEINNLILHVNNLKEIVS